MFAELWQAAAVVAEAPSESGAILPTGKEQ
jgi:hypothetical protein